ncbi:multidrug efflux SMR transporter [Rossellomorea aquimaris]|uniref:DMT family transporter n=1 Tax=Rossellomorea aquimaris TaxID=189382 RepID=UPI001CD71EE2|nr:multidrug efflux SMR transporter [Rossellomorea aquimaris]MCA1055851.1 multidrug efflux SMR transporter [Rossellomorea aquimaris]
MKTYLLLGISIVSEVTGATFIKYSDGFTDFSATVIVILSYSLAVALYILITKDHEIGIINALWSGGGTVLVTLLGLMLFEESWSIQKGIGLALIFTGIIGLTLQPDKERSA